MSRLTVAVGHLCEQRGSPQKGRAPPENPPIVQHGCHLLRCKRQFTRPADDGRGAEWLPLKIDPNLAPVQGPVAWNTACPSARRAFMIMRPCWDPRRRRRCAGPYGRQAEDGSLRGRGDLVQDQEQGVHLPNLSSVGRAGRESPRSTCRRVSGARPPTPAQHSHLLPVAEMSREYPLRCHRTGSKILPGRGAPEIRGPVLATRPLT